MMNDTYVQLKRDIDKIPFSTVKMLENQIKTYLDKCGLFYKVFTRIKDSNSIIEKMIH